MPRKIDANLTKGRWIRMTTKQLQLVQELSLNYELSEADIMRIALRRGLTALAAEHGVLGKLDVGRSA